MGKKNWIFQRTVIFGEYMEINYWIDEVMHDINRLYHNDGDTLNECVDLFKDVDILKHIVWKEQD